MCSYCGCSHTRRLCAYPACYIFSWWRRPRPPRELPLERLIYRRRFALLSAHLVSFFYMPFRSASRIYRLAFRLVPCRPASRFAYRPASRLASRLAFRFSYRSCVSSCVLSLRFAFLVCPLVMVFDTGAVSSCSPLVLRSAVYLVLRVVPASRAMPFVRLALRFALRLVIVSRFSACPWAMAFDEAPFRPACRLPSRLACRSSVSPLRAVLRPVFITRFARLRS